MAALRELKKSVFENQPWEVWNEFVHLLAFNEPDDLTEIQRPAHFVFVYYNEVNNGGHLQYFLNQGVEAARETVESLIILEDHFHSQVLGEALSLWLSRASNGIETVDEFVEAQWEEEFIEFDEKAYGGDGPKSLEQVLQDYLENHFDDFLKLVS